MAKKFADKAPGCIGAARFSAKDIARLEERVELLKQDHEFDDENHAYAEAATRIAAEAHSAKSLILATLQAEDVNKAAARPVPTESKHDNVPDLADAVAKENGLSQNHADAYVQHVEEGRSFSNIATDMGIGKSTVGDMVTKMKAKMEEAKPSRLEAGDHGEEASRPEEAIHDETKNDVAHTSDDAVDADNPMQGQADRGDSGLSNINISDSPHGEGATKATNDPAADAAYKSQRQVKDPELQKAWDRINESQPKKGQVEFKALGEGQKLMFEEATRKGAEAAVEEHIAVSEAHNEVGKFSKDSDTGKGTTGEAIQDTLKKWFPGQLKQFADKVVIHDTAKEAETAVPKLASEGTGNVKAFYDTETGKVHMVAENIKPGQELGVFLHEMGVHATLSTVLRGRMELLARTVMGWSKGKGPEAAIGKAAMKRVFEYQIGQEAEGRTVDPQLRNEELVAYAVEEAANRGIEPSAKPDSTPLQQWMSRMLNHFKEALGKLMGVPTGKLPDMTAQHLVDMAYGAAHMDLPAPDKAAGGVKLSIDSAPMLEKARGALDYVKSLVSEKLYRTHPNVLGFATTEQLGSMFPHLKEAELYSKTMQHMAGATGQMMHNSDAIIKLWAQAKQSGGKENSARFDALLNRSTRTQVWPDRPLDDKSQSHLDISDPKVIAEHKALQREWTSLPEAFRNVFAETQKDHADRFDRYIAAQKDNVARAFYPAVEGVGPSKEAIDAAAKLPVAEREKLMADNPKDASTYAQMFDALSQIKKQEKLIGPYAPQARFGDHIVSYKSPEVLKAQKELDQAIKVQKATTDAADLEIAKKAVETQTEALAALKNDASHYNVEFFENRNEAKTREEELQRFFGNDGTEVKRSLRDQFLTAQDSITPSWVKRIEAHLTASLTGADATSVAHAVREMYLQHLPGTSVLKSQMKRRNVPGVKDSEASRSFANKSMRDAYAISRLEHGSQLQEHVQTLRGADGEDSKLVGNELAKRIAQNFTLKTSNVLSALTTATYFTQLGMSPGFMLMQGTQVWVNTAPIMAARHGFKSLAMLGKGTTDAGKLLKISMGGSKDKMDFQVDIPAGVKAGLISETEGRLLKDMFDRGRIDITTQHDLGIANAGREPGMVSKAAAMSNWPVKQLETINRISTALAGFRAEHESRIKGGHSADEAFEHASRYADTLVSETHMNYATENRARYLHPSVLGGWGRVMFQFRAYQQGMAYLTIKNMAGAMKGDTESMRALAYMAGTQMAVAGTNGLPIPGVTAVLARATYNLFQPDDEKVTANQVKEAYFQGLKSVLGEKVAQAFSQGLPAAAGVNVSEKLGMGHTFDVAPFANDNAKNAKDLFASYFYAAAGGPAAGIAANYGEAIRLASHGEIAKAAATAAPKVLSDAIKAEEMQRKGITDTRGNTVLKPEEVSMVDSLIKGLGMQPEDLSRTMDQRGAFFDARATRHDTRATLLTQFAQATLRGEDASKVGQEILDFNERHPDSKIAAGQKQLAVVKMRENERLMKNGVPVGKRDKQLAADMGIE